MPGRRPQRGHLSRVYTCIYMVTFTYALYICVSRVAPVRFVLCMCSSACLCLGSFVSSRARVHLTCIALVAADTDFKEHYMVAGVGWGPSSTRCYQIHDDSCWKLYATTSTTTWRYTTHRLRRNAEKIFRRA